MDTPKHYGEVGAPDDTEAQRIGGALNENAHQKDISIDYGRTMPRVGKYVPGEATSWFSGTRKSPCIT